MLNRMFVRNAAQVVAQDRSVGGEGLSFAGMELKVVGLSTGLSSGSGWRLDMRGSSTQCTKRS